MNYWDLQIIRATVLNDVAKFVPTNHYNGMISGIEKGTADWKLGKMFFSTNPEMEPRQFAACEVLIWAGLYGATDDALTRSTVVGERLLEENQALRTVYSQVLKSQKQFKSNLYECVKRYAMYLTNNEANLLLSLTRNDGIPEDVNQLELETNSSNEGREIQQLDVSSGGDSNDLFDPLSRKAIIELFNIVTESKWKKYFERAAQNGLINARNLDGSKSFYDPMRVADWLVRKGYYTQERVDRLLAAALPRHKKHLKYLITGDIE